MLRGRNVVARRVVDDIAEVLQFSNILDKQRGAFCQVGSHLHLTIYGSVHFGTQHYNALPSVHDTRQVARHFLYIYRIPLYHLPFTSGSDFIVIQSNIVYHAIVNLINRIIGGSGAQRHDGGTGDVGSCKIFQLREEIATAVGVIPVCITQSALQLVTAHFLRQFASGIVLRKIVHTTEERKLLVVVAVISAPITAEATLIGAGGQHRVGVVGIRCLAAAAKTTHIFAVSAIHQSRIVTVTHGVPCST